MNIVINTREQKLFLYLDDRLVMSFSISTAKNGLGEKWGSFQTPRGLHAIYEKIGSGQPINSVFVARQCTGEIYSKALGEKYPDRDWILTRILRLQGLEPGKNLGGDVDTLTRAIYLHGVPDDYSMGQPLSDGCIRMRNEEIIELFEEVEVNTPVLIE